MQLKDYQQRVLDCVDRYLDVLAEERDKSERAVRALLDSGIADADIVGSLSDFPSKAWERLRSAGSLPIERRSRPYSPRTGPAGRPVPNATLKVPTGGGKTLLAAATVARILNKHLERNTGFVLWIVPNESIYAQTKKRLTDREDPYRRMLDLAAAGSVRFLEKDSPVSRADVDGSLCVMLLMLQSASREDRETLRLFRDRGNVRGFTPASDDVAAHEALIARVPGLDTYAGGAPESYPIVKDSLGNALRITRPIVVMDEGQRAYSDTAFNTIYTFNPSFVLELSATPRDRADRWSNWLVDVRGSDLDREEMIKLPINLTVKAGDDWRDCLRAALDTLSALDTAAGELLANTSRYIRPIMLIQVERVGARQLESGKIHVQDVIGHLKSVGLHDDEIAEKTSEKNDLTDPEREDLLSPTNRTRVILTRQALQEGWDCPFAYVLCILAASHSPTATTQLVGRILRQPEARKTGISVLDESYVFCYHATTAAIVQGIRQALEKDGMSDVAGRIQLQQAGGTENRAVFKMARRPHLRDSRLFLPRVLWHGDSAPRDLDWEQDILSRVDWSEAQVGPYADRLTPDGRGASSYMARIDLQSGIPRGTKPEVRHSAESLTFDPVYATRSVNDIVPNPWIARDLVERYIGRLLARGWTAADLGGAGSYVVEELRRAIASELDRLAEHVYRSDLAENRISFNLLTDALNWELPVHETLDAPVGTQLMMTYENTAPQRSLLEPVYRYDYNELEYDVACYLDGEDAISWWYRNVVRPSGYSIVGWRKHRVYPDFLFAHASNGETVILETKGDQLAGNLDTRYKQGLMKALTQRSGRPFRRLGSIEIETDDRHSVRCDLVYDSEWRASIAQILHGPALSGSQTEPAG